ncbi:hypothetical protein K9L97_02540 [Candidatus Woesearchaeota archaeon]|nr:hypothetical protein [Candidatus Woesearchaeota archaeon]
MIIKKTEELIKRYGKQHDYEKLTTKQKEFVSNPLIYDYAPGNPNYETIIEKIHENKITMIHNQKQKENLEEQLETTLQIYEYITKTKKAIPTNKTKNTYQLENNITIKFT